MFCILFIHMQSVLMYSCVTKIIFIIVVKEVKVFFNSFLYLCHVIFDLFTQIFRGWEVEDHRGEADSRVKSINSLRQLKKRATISTYSGQRQTISRWPYIVPKQSEQFYTALNIYQTIQNIFQKALSSFRQSQTVSCQILVDSKLSEQDIDNPGLFLVGSEQCLEGPTQFLYNTEQCLEGLHNFYTTLKNFETTLNLFLTALNSSQNTLNCYQTGQNS